MKRFQTITLLLGLLVGSSISVLAQERYAIWAYKVGDKLFTRDALGGTPTTNPFVNTSVDATNTLIQLTIGKLVRYYTPDKFLDGSGVPWGSTVIDAVTAFQNAASPTIITGSGSAVTDASLIVSGTLSEARLPSSVVKTTATITNPMFFTGLDPARINETTSKRFTSDAEKASWNAKPDLAAVRQAQSDSLRNITIVGATAVTVGNSTTLTLTDVGGASIVDSTLNTTSTNPVTNRATTTAILANTTSITAIQAQVANLSSTVQSAITALQSANIYLLSTPTLTATLTSFTIVNLSWPLSTSATGYSVDRSTSSDFSTGVVSTTVTSTTLLVTGLSAPITYYFRVRAFGVGNTAPSGYGVAMVTTETVPPYTASTPVRLAFQSASLSTAIPTSSTAIGGAGIWNRAIPSTSATPNQLTTAGVYSLTGMVDASGIATPYSMSITGGFTQTTGNSYTAVSGSLYDAVITQRGWQSTITNTNGGEITISGFNPNHYVQFYAYGIFTISGSTTTYTLTGATTTATNKLIFNNTGIGLGNEFDPNGALVYFKNVQANSSGQIKLNVKYFSGSHGTINAATWTTSVVPAP